MARVVLPLLDPNFDHDFAIEDTLPRYEECGHPVLSAAFLPDAPVIAVGLRPWQQMAWGNLRDLKV